MERLRSTPQERWAPNTPQRRLVEQIFAGTSWAAEYASGVDILDLGEIEELDDLLKAVTGFYHMAQVHAKVDPRQLEQIDRLLLALTDPVPAGRGSLVGEAALRKASGFDRSEISDYLREISTFARINGPLVAGDSDTSPVQAITDHLRDEITEMSEVMVYRISDKLHTLAGQVAALYSNGNGHTALRVRLLQQHLSLNATAPLHMVDSPTLRATLRGFGRHHAAWMAHYDNGMEQPEAQLINVLTGHNGSEPESLRETLACMTAEEIDEIETTLVTYLQEFIDEYGGGEDLPEEDEELDWPVAPDFMRRLLDGADHLGEWVRSAAGSRRATHNVLRELQAAHAAAPPPYRTDDGDELLRLLVAGEAVDENDYAETIDILVALFTTPIEEVNEVGASVSARAVRAEVVDAFLGRLDDVTAGRAEGENAEDEDVEDAEEIEDDEEELEDGEDPVELERRRAAEVAADEAEEVEELDDKGEPGEDEIGEIEVELEDVDDVDLDAEIDERVVASRTPRTATLAWNGGVRDWRPGATVPMHDRVAADRPTAFTSTGVPAIARPHAASDFDERRVAAVTNRTLERPAAAGEHVAYAWDNIPKEVADMATVAVFEALVTNSGLEHEGIRRAVTGYINGDELTNDIMRRDDIRRGFEAVRRQFDAFSRALRAEDRLTVAHTAGTTSLRYLLNGQFTSAADRISAELDLLARHVLAHSRAQQSV